MSLSKILNKNRIQRSDQFIDQREIGANEQIRVRVGKKEGTELFPNQWICGCPFRVFRVVRLHPPS